MHLDQTSQMDFLKYIDPEHPIPSEKNGMLTLLKNAVFPWQDFPYPRQHAEIGAYYASKDEEHSKWARQMLLFQQATFTHEKKPLFSFFRQEEGYSYKELEEANARFFKATHTDVEQDYAYVDIELGIVSKRNLSQTLICLASGCKSGLGAFLIKDAGILNMGPELNTLGVWDSFGIAGRAQKVQYKEFADTFQLSFISRLAALHPQERKYLGLQDSGYSGVWLEAHIEGGFDKLSYVCTFSGRKYPPLFVFLGKANGCFVSQTHKLRPKSFDRYKGPSQEILLEGSQGAVRVIPMNSTAEMEIIPLGGSESFWGADFLIAYHLQQPIFSFEIKRALP